MCHISCVRLFMSGDENTGRNYNLTIANESYDGVETFRNLGTTITSQNCINEEIDNILNSGNAAILSLESFVLPSYF